MRLPAELDPSFGRHQSCSSVSFDTASRTWAGRTRVMRARREARVAERGVVALMTALFSCKMRPSFHECRLSSRRRRARGLQLPGENQTQTIEDNFMTDILT